MKKTTAALTAITFLLFSCSNRDNRVTVEESFNNGQPKSTIYRTIDSNNTYYRIEYDSLGRIRAVIPFNSDKENGTGVYFRLDNLGVAGLAPRKDGKREGVHYEFYPRQKIAFMGDSKDGEFNGVVSSFYENGKTSATGNYSNGEREGEWIEYYESGQLKCKGTYSNDLKQNDWTYWKSDGTIDTTIQIERRR